MYVTVVPNRASPPAILLRESFREEGRVQNRTLANLSHWPADKIAALRSVLRDDLTALRPAGPALRLEQAFDVVRTLPHGHVAAVLSTLRLLGLERMLGARRSVERDLCVAMITARVLSPASKLATARGLAAETAETSLASVLGLGDIDADSLYHAMDWLRARQPSIERHLARGHLSAGTLVLYDVTSTYVEGRHNALAARGYSRDGRPDRAQVVFGLLTTREGCPIAVEVFAGNTSDPRTVGPQIEKLRDRFGLEKLVLVGDRGMLTHARLREQLAPLPGLDWITALRAPAIQELVHSGTLQLSLFDQMDLAEIAAPDYPGERLIVCRNPLLAAERARKRRELLAATERVLAPLVAATTRERRPLRGETRIALRVGRVLGRYKMAKHFEIAISDSTLQVTRNEVSIAQEAALDGFYVVRTSVGADRLTAAEVVRAYKGLSNVERAFRILKGEDLQVRPIHHRLAERVRSHIFLCMLAYYVEWHMRRALAPLLFEDHDRAAAAAERASVVAPATRSSAARRKAHTRRTAEGEPVHSFRSLLRDLATLAKSRVQPRTADAPGFELITRPTPLQRRAFQLLKVSEHV